MNFRQLDCFLTVADCLNFSEAAKRLFLSQSTVSQQIASLERELGFAVFERSRHHVQLTPAGSYLHDRYLQIKRDYEAANERAAAIAGTRDSSLFIGCDGPLSEPLVGTACKLFRDRIPDVGVKLVRMPAIDMPGLLLTGAVDAAFVTDTEVDGYDSVRFHPLKQGSACVFYPAGHRFEQMRYVLPSDLEGEDVISAYARRDSSSADSKTLAVLAEHGIDLTAACKVPDGDTAFLSVQAGLGVFIASHLCDHYASRFGIGSVDLFADLPAVTLGLAWIESKPHLDDFLLCAETAIASGNCGQQAAPQQP